MPALNIERRDQVCDAAIELIAREGLRGLTHRAVDAAAGVPPGTTSRYFRTRELLLRAVVDRVTRVRSAKLRDVTVPRAGPSHLAEAITRAAAEAITFNRSHQLALHELQLEGTRRPYLGKILAEATRDFERVLVELCAKAGIAVTEHDAMLLDMLGTGVLFTTLTTRPEASEHLHDLVRTGVGRILADHLPASPPD